LQKTTKEYKENKEEKNYLHVSVLLLAFTFSSSLVNGYVDQEFRSRALTACCCFCVFFLLLSGVIANTK
jgi:hypothetical protein